jgi:hypothetical protein
MVQARAAVVMFRVPTVGAAVAIWQGMIGVIQL